MTSWEPGREDDLEPDEDALARAENRREAWEMERWIEGKYQRRADPKPEKRQKDPGVFRTFHAHGHDCLSCGHGRFIQAHHLLGGSRREDVLANLVPLCLECHGAYHGNPYRAFGVRIDAAHVRYCIARFLRSEAGEDHAAYLRRKLGEFQAEDFVQRLEA